MNVLAIIIVLFLSSTSLFGQEKDTYWFTSFEEAKVYSVEKEVPVVLVFAGSDWCRPCIQFKRSILQNTEVIQFAKKNLAILYVDFPARKKNKLSPELSKQNDVLAEKYNRSGAFPKVVMINSDGTILKQITAKNQQPQDFIRNCSTK